MHQENLSYDLQRADNSFSAKLGSLKYLKTLRKKQYSGSQPDPCPICKNQLEDNVSHQTVVPKRERGGSLAVN